MTMTETDYKECRFIDIEMRFNTFEEFVRDAGAIKRLYGALNHKLFYKWYVYSHLFSTIRKNAIWEYLNDDIDYEKLTKM